MIASLRKRHRHLIFCLAPAALILFSLAVTSRNQVPSDNLLPEPADAAVDLERIFGLPVEGDEAAHFSASLLKGAAGRFIEIAPVGIKKFPDVLIYQTAEKLTDATLLGSYKGITQHYQVSEEPVIIVYSLAHQKELIRISLEGNS